MLLDTERKILKYISKNPENHQLNCDEFPKFSKQEIREAMKQLMSKGYLDKLTGDLGWNTITYNLTANGIYYREYIARKFLRDIIIPILVSIITTLITMNLAI